jgi:DNA repair protein RecN (Recombination protein N)
MLSFLSIRDLAVVEKVSLELSGGFVAVTGETGAGKSVILGALGLLAGRRADREAIRDGAGEAVVEGALCISGTRLVMIDSFLEGLSLPKCEDGQLLIQRTIHREKSGRILVNGMLTTLTNLQKLGGMWLDILGSGQAQMLFDEKSQLAILDGYAKNEALTGKFAEDYHRWRALLSKAEDLRNSRRMGPDEIDFFRAQIEKVERAKLSEESVGKLERDFTRLEGARDLIAGASGISAKIQGGKGICAMVAETVIEARRLSRTDPQLSELASRLDSASIELADIAADYARAARECAFDERTAKALRERMELWMELKRKYGPDVKTVLAKAAEMKDRLAGQSNIGEAIAKLLADADKIRADLIAQGEVLCTRREDAAHALGEKTGELLSKLGFKHAQLRVEVLHESEIREYGTSSCRIVFAPNPGLPPRPLAKIASSGELARVMLAIKTTLAEADETPVLVFDEVDANVGGEAAVEVGRQLAHLGKHHQVFVITHLPQVASQASSHYLVEKRQEAGTTHVSIAAIHGDKKRRVAELARMLGDRNSKEAVDHAQSLLEKAVYSISG